MIFFINLHFDIDKLASLHLLFDKINSLPISDNRV